MEHSQAYQIAKKRVEARLGFYTHLTIYVAIILLLAVINFVSASGTMWVHWPAMGWGIAVALHAVFVFVFPHQFAVTDSMIEKEMSKSRLRSVD